MITEVAVHEVKLEQIQKTLDEILKHVKETNGSIAEHSEELAVNKEWKDSAGNWKSEVDTRFDRLESRLWAMTIGGSLFGSIIGGMASIAVEAMK